jgi:hypothetical protein
LKTVAIAAVIAAVVTSNPFGDYVAVGPLEMDAPEGNQRV